MAYIKINTSAGPAFFEQTSGGLAAVSNPQVLQGLKSGAIPSTVQTAEQQIGAKAYSPTPLPVTQTTPTQQSPQSILPSLPPAGQVGQQAALPPTYTPPTYTPPTLPQRGPAPTLTLPQAPQNNLLAFMTTLESTLDLARQKRLAMQKQFLGRVVEPGAMSATDFASILGNIDVGASRFGERVAQATSEGAQSEFNTQQRNYELQRNQAISDFEYQRAQGESDYEFQRSQALQQSEQDYNRRLGEYEDQQKQKQSDRNAINELYVSLAPKLDQKTLDAIINAGSYEAALRIAGPALQKETGNKFKLEQVGSTVYEIEQDKDGKVLNKRVIVQGTNTNTNTGQDTQKLSASEGYFNTKTESSVREDVVALQGEGKTPEEAYKTLRQLYSSQEVSDEALRKLVGLQSDTPETPEEAANEWLGSALLGKGDSVAEQIAGAPLPGKKSKSLFNVN